MDEVEYNRIQSILDEDEREMIQNQVNYKVVAQGRSRTLSARFKKGLDDEGIPLKDIDNGTWKYAGGDSNEHLRYFHQCRFKIRAPLHKEWCICGQEIKENCYITDLNRFVIIGNCCIKKFLAKSGRTCELCGEPHRHRIGNLCKACRVGRCWTCTKPIDRKYTSCWTCKNEDHSSDESESESKSTSESDREYIKTCTDCDKPIDKKYTKCWSCNQSKPSHKDHSGICINCDKSIDCKYIRCYTCNKNR